ncbi:hypothetical protein Tco_0778719, partial [Tanacetum coccineum]
VSTDMLRRIFNGFGNRLIWAKAYQGELGRLLFISPIVSGADLLSLADYDPGHEEVKPGMFHIQPLWWIKWRRLLNGEYGLETTLFHGIYLTQRESSDALLLQQTQARIPRNKKDMELKMSACQFLDDHVDKKCFRQGGFGYCHVVGGDAIGLYVKMLSTMFLYGVTSSGKTHTLHVCRYLASLFSVFCSAPKYE